MKTVVIATTIVLSCHAPADAQDWTREAAIDEMRELVLNRRPMDEWPERDRAIADWLKRVDQEGLDLGDHKFLRGIALYFQKDYEGGAALVFESLDEKAGLPTDDFNTIAGRLVLVHAVAGVREGRYDAVPAATETAAHLYSDRLLVYRTVIRAMRQRTGTDALSALNQVLATMLLDEALDAEAKQDLLTSLYGTESQPRQNTPPEPEAESNRTLKPFAARDINGDEISLESLRGKVILVDFWATWCGPCMREMPHVVAAYDEYRDEGFVVIGISLDQEPGQSRGGDIIAPDPDSVTLAKIRHVARTNNMSWPIVYEGGGWETRLAVENGIRSIPATFLLDREGKIRYTNLRGTALRDRVAELIEE